MSFFEEFKKFAMREMLSIWQSALLSAVPSAK